MTLPLAFLMVLVVLLQTGCSLFGIRTTEEANYSVLRNDDNFEVREYEALLVAETWVDSDYDEAGNIAFRRLFNYISGDNEIAAEISMTAPVMALDETDSSGKEISMTAPVTGQETSGGWRFAFVLPAGYTLETAPTPSHPEVTLVEVPASMVAVLRYSGSSTEEAYQRNLKKLQQWMQQNRLEADSLPSFAGYDPPWTLPFLRRNEVMIDIKI
ncbi:MAG: heme-binding protein [Pseudomonadota bacterium]